MRDQRALSIAFALFVFVLAGCGSGVYKGPVPTPAAPPGSGPVASQGGSVTVAPRYAAVGLGGTVQLQAAVTGGGSVQWSVNGVPGGNTTLGTIDANGKFTAPNTPGLAENVSVTAALPGSSQTNYATSIVSVIAPGTVTATANPQVASYSIYLPSGGSVYVEFGPSTAYGLPTSMQLTPSTTGGQVTVLVAGMRGSTAYHMRARVVLNNGATLADADQTFTTGAPPVTGPVAITTSANITPQPGVELFDTLQPYEPAQAFVTDLSGNVIWTYTYTGPKDDLVYPIKLLPNGHFLALISYASSILVKGAQIQPGSLDEVREVDLAGNTIRSITEAEVASALTSQGYNLQFGSLHHDVLALPNGHMLLLMSVYKSFNNLPGYPGTTNVLGDLLIDVDQNLTPDWVWNTFDHLDVNRHPYLFPDWTHSNALLYSADDHNLLLSVRHQNWLLKIDFQDGKGTGDVIWKLGEGGDFKLQNGTDPTDWFYAQHGPSYFTTNTTGVFTLGLMDNGDDREFPGGVTCGTTGAPPCYSTAPVLQINETARTATLLEHYAPGVYSFFGGSVAQLANGDMEVDFCSDKGGSVIQDLRGPDGSKQVVWSAVTSGTNQYRTERLPSLYPGVQW